MIDGVAPTFLPQERDVNSGIDDDEKNTRSVHAATMQLANLQRGGDLVKISDWIALHTTGERGYLDPRLRVDTEHVRIVLQPLEDPVRIRFPRARPHSPPVPSVPVSEPFGLGQPLELPDSAPIPPPTTARAPIRKRIDTAYLRETFDGWNCQHYNFGRGCGPERAFTSRVS